MLAVGALPPLGTSPRSGEKITGVSAIASLLEAPELALVGASWIALAALRAPPRSMILDSQP